jgi:type I restriction enzyme S subunit
MVPKGWNTKPLADIVKEKISYGIVQAGPHIPDGIPYIKSSDIRGSINPEELQRTSKEIHFKYRRSSVHPGDIVFSLRGNIGESSIVPDSLPEANLTQGTARISVSGEHCNRFYYYQLSSEKLLNRINALSKGSTFKEISLEELRKVNVLCAPLPEQKKIAQILSTWDKAITTTEQLLANSQQQKNALMQQLLTGEKRLLDNNGVRFSGEWKHGDLSDLGKITKGKALSSKDLIDGDYPVIAGGKSSPYNHRDFTHENVITVSASGAYAGYVAYHPYKLWASDCSVVIGKTNSDICFIYQLMLYMQSKIYSLQSGGAQPHVYPKDLEVLRVRIPPLEEQQKIAAVLSITDQENAVLQQTLDTLKQEKKALMQQLLTGKRRVRVEQ